MKALTLTILVLTIATASAQEKAKPVKPTAASDTLLPRTAVVQRIESAIRIREKQIEQLSLEIRHLQGMWQGVNVVRDSMVTIEKAWWKEGS